MNKPAIQGHIYKLAHYTVMAMDSGETPNVMIVDHNSPWPLRRFGRVNVESLEPLPMVYFGGEVPQ